MVDKIDFWAKNRYYNFIELISRRRIHMETYYILATGTYLGKRMYQGVVARNVFETDDEAIRVLIPKLNRLYEECDHVTAKICNEDRNHHVAYEQL
jgi:hypothetical protein